MTSSTSLPPKHARKFQFDTDFELEEERLRTEALQHPELHEPEEIVPPAPVFSEEQMSGAQQEGFKQGFEQGQNEARTSIENNLATLLTMLTSSMETLVANEDKRLQQMYEIVLRTTMATLKKTCPTIFQSQGLAMVENTVRQSLEYNPEETRIVIRVHDTMLDPLIKRLPQIQSQKAFAGKIIVLADETVGVSDCKVEWADGGMERLSRTLSAQIDQALERVLASLPNNSTTDTERTSQ